VVGHVGRFHPQKNHSFLVNVAQRIAARRQDAYFLLIGDGALRETTHNQVRQQGLDDRFVFTGDRTDVPDLLQAMDVFCFPSLYEGLPNALLEAQAVGLPCVVSDRITGETTAIESQVSQLPIDLSPDRWADRVIEMSAQDRRKNHPVAWTVIAQGEFSIDYCVDQLVSIYRSGGTRSNGSS
jgi:glycosyltransferase involved in cell wall biosynthesis